MFVRYLHRHSLNLHGFWLGRQLGVSSPQGEGTSPTDRERETLEFLLSHLPVDCEHFNGLRSALEVSGKTSPVRPTLCVQSLDLITFVPSGGRGGQKLYIQQHTCLYAHHQYHCAASASSYYPQLPGAGAGTLPTAEH